MEKGNRKETRRYNVPEVKRRKWSAEKCGAQKPLRSVRRIKLLLD